MIVAKDVCKSYGKAEVLKNLSLTVQEGEIVVILGRSGIGKSVLLKQIIGIETPEKGYVEVKGQRISELSRVERYKAIKDMGMLFQGSALFDSMTVEENTGFHLEQHHLFPSKEIKKKVIHALELVGLKDAIGKMPGSLSGGMRKRAAIARLIVYHPSIMLYDEPTTGLDPLTSDNIVELIDKTRRELNASGIVVTHDIRAALKLGDRLAFLHDGKILHIAPKHEFMKIQDPILTTFLEKSMVTDSYLKQYEG